MPTVAIVDDSVLIREGLARLLDEVGFDVAGLYSEADTFLQKLSEAAPLPDVVIMDVRMPPTFTNEGVSAALHIRDRYPQIAVLLLSQYVESAYANELFARGVGGVGYLLKDRVLTMEDLKDAIDRITAGGVVLDPEVVAGLMQARTAPLAKLTGREQEVLALMAKGYTNTEIAGQAMVGIGTVEKQVSSILTKLDLGPDCAGHRRVLAVLKWLRNQRDSNVGNRGD